MFIRSDPESCYQQNIDMSGGDLGSLVPEPKTNSECYKACKRYAACIVSENYAYIFKSLFLLSGLRS